MEVMAASETPIEIAAQRAKLRKRDKVVYKELTGRKWRAAIVLNMSRSGDAVKLLWYNGSSVCDQDVNIHLVRAPTSEEALELEEHWRALSADGRLDGGDGDHKPVLHVPLYKHMQKLGHKANAIGCLHGRQHVRLMTWNVKHYGAAAARLRIRDREERERLEALQSVHDDERARNLVEVIHASRCMLVVLQEISKDADTQLLCRLLDERATARGGTGDAGWRSTRVIGEHAMLYRAGALAAALSCPPEALQVECGLYERGETLSPEFRAATDWAALSPRFDFGMQGASAARSPAVFFLRDGRSRPSDESAVDHSGHDIDPTAISDADDGAKGNAEAGASSDSDAESDAGAGTDVGIRGADVRADGDAGSRVRADSHAGSPVPRGHSVAICSVHLAYGRGGVSETRERQLAHLASLMPGAGYEPSRCLYALMGDMNSNASVAERGHDLASSSVGEQLMASLQSATPGHVLALPAGQKTSIGGERYDEVIVHRGALGRRHAHVYPSRDQIVAQMRAALPETEQIDSRTTHMAFCNIFSDHLPVYVDLQFGAMHERHRAPRSLPTLALSSTAQMQTVSGVAEQADKEAGGTSECNANGSERSVSQEREGAIRCKLCSAGKGCRWRGRPGHADAVPASGGEDARSSGHDVLW